MIAKKHLMLIALGACLVGLPSLGSMKNPVARPYKGRLQATTVIDLSDGSLVTKGEGRESHLGHTSAHTFGVADPEKLIPLYLKGTITAANGDQVFIELAGASFQVTGGTGRFEGASGSINQGPLEDLKVTVDFPIMTITYSTTMEGTLIY